jgi:hypothetical protein
MAKNASGLTARDVAFQNVQIGAANGGSSHPNDRVRGRENIWLGAIFQGLLARASIDERFHDSLDWSVE